MNNQDRILALFHDDRLIRKSWVGTDAQGRETLCLLAALSPEVAATYDAADCPATVMPKWLARLTPWIDDAGSEEAWPAMIRRYAAVAGRWHIVSEETWKRLNYTVRRLCVEEAARHFDHEEHPLIIAAAKRVIALCRGAETGDWPDDDKLKAAKEGAAWAVWAAAGEAQAVRAAAEAVRAAAEAMRAAADRLTDAILAEIEKACGIAERKRRYD